MVISRSLFSFLYITAARGYSNSLLLLGLQSPFPRDLLIYGYKPPRGERRSKVDKRRMPEKQTSETFNFKKVPKALGISGTPTVPLSQLSTPYSIRTTSTSVTSTPLSCVSLGIPKEYKFNTPSSTPLSAQRKSLSNVDGCNCSYCQEPLQNIFEGEKIIDLQCGHIIHFECLKELLIIPNFATETLLGDANNDQQQEQLICPACHRITSCADEAILLNISDSPIKGFYDKVLLPSDGYSNIMASIDNFQFHNVSTNGSKNLPVDDKSDTEEPSTPQNQTGSKFWEREEELALASLQSPDNSPFSAKTEKSSPFSKNNGIELARTLFAPEFSSININDRFKLEIGCVFNLSVTKFEASLKFNKKEQIKAQIGKNKITNNIINNFEQNVSNAKVDFSTVGSLILFDLMDVTIRMSTFISCQVFLFESNLIILNSEGKQILLNQELNSQTFISSIYTKEKNVIINLNSIKLSSIVFTSDNSILRNKWYVILSKICKNIAVADTIPLIQTSTNAWGLISEGDNDDVVPNDIKVLKKLTSRGLDLPSGFLRRQILTPDPIPMVLIVSVPLVNCEDYGLENTEYAEIIKSILTSILNSLHSEDKLGVVFLGNHAKNLSTLGNYYGCISKSWDGWDVMLGLITEKVIRKEGDLSASCMWEQGIKYIELLASIGFSNHGIEGGNYLHQIICISNELINDFDSTEPIIKRNKRSQKSNLPAERRKNSHKKINERISYLCSAFDANFNLILLADEFKFEVCEIMSMNRYLREKFYHGFDKSVYDNRFKLSIALDFENLKEVLESLLESFHSTIIRNLETTIAFPEFVSVKKFESVSDKHDVSTVNQSTASSNEFSVKLRNLPSGYDRSLLFNLELNLNDRSVRDQYKIAIAKSLTKLISDKDVSQLESQCELKLVSSESYIESNITFNLNLEESNDPEFATDGKIRGSRNPGDALNLSIVSRLSNVSDAYYIGRKIQLLVTEKLRVVVLEVEDFDRSAREYAKSTLSELTHTIWEYANSCNSSNTNNIRDQNIEKWSESLIQRLEDIIDGYSLRNHQLSSMKCMFLFLDLE